MFKNTLHQIIANIFSAILLLLLLTLLSKKLGVYEFGRYQLAITIGNFAFLLQDFGFKNLIFREFTYPSVQIKPIINQLFSTALCHLLIMSIILIILIQIFPEKLLWSLAIIFYGLYAFVFFVSSYLKAKAEFILDAKWNLWFKFTTTLIVIIPLGFIDLRPEEVLGLSIVGALINFMPLFKKTEQLSLNTYNLQFYRFSYHFFLIDLFTQLYFKSDMLLIAYLQGYRENGLYAAAYRLIEGSNFFIAPIIFIFFQKLRTFCLELDKFKQLFKIYLLYSVLMALGICLIGLLGADFIIQSFYGDQYISAVPIFKILIVANFFMVLNFFFSQTLISLNQEQYYTKITAILAALNIGLNLLIIPAYGSKGAAITTVITEMIFWILLAVKLRQIVERRFAGNLPHFTVHH